MDIFKKITRIGHRFETSKGLLSVEQVWSLKLSEIAEVLKATQKTLFQDFPLSADLDFLNEAQENKRKDLLELQFAVLKEIYLTLLQEKEAARDKQDRKVRNEKLMELIQEKKAGILKEKTLEELEAMLEAE